MRYLVDTSALVRILRQQADPQWTELVVLHEDADFETAARVIPQLREQRLGGSTP